MQIDRERLATLFTELCEIESPSRQEGRIAQRLRQLFTELQATEILEDDSASLTQSASGNLIIRFAGALALEPIFFSCHMDTVGPTAGLRVRRQGDRFTSVGNTILGGDDKSGIAACIEAMRVLKEAARPHRPVEFILTTCEEVGLEGAKALNASLIQARQGYALDSSGFGRVVTHAPAANKLHISVYGVAAHAGLHPEWGVNAIVLAAQALARVPCGRIDEETTANFGVINGGMAANIVPEQVVIHGEVRSHSPEKLRLLTAEIKAQFHASVDGWRDVSGMAKGRPQVEAQVREDFPAMAIAKEHALIQRIEEAGRAIGLPLSYEKAGGGSDANIFNGKGLATAIVATGMNNVHSTEEYVELHDMVELTRLIIALLVDTRI